MRVGNELERQNKFGEFMAYYCEWFDDDLEFFWFHKFKSIVREVYKTMNIGDMGYQAVKEICRPTTKDLYAVAVICFNLHQPAFKDAIMSWMDLAKGETSTADSKYYLRKVGSFR